MRRSSARGSLPHLLAVRQMTGVVIRHRQRQPDRAAASASGQHLGDVADAAGQPRGRRVGQPVAVVAHRRAAPGRVGDDAVDVRRQRRRQRPRRAPGTPRRGRRAARARRSSPARADHDVPAGQRQQPHRVAVDVGKRWRCTQPVSTRDAPASLARAPAGTRARGRLGHVGQQTRPSRPAAGSARGRRCARTSALKAPALIAPGQAQQRAQPRRDAGRPRTSSASASGVARRPVPPMSARAVSSSEPKRTPAGHAVSHARQPRQRSRWLRELLGDRQAAFGHRAHQVETAARRVHLLAEHAVGRALRQADAAVHARAQRRRASRARSASGRGEAIVRCRRRSGPG